MRRVLLVTALAVAHLAGTSAAAPGDRLEGALRLTLTYSCFGCGTSEGTLSGTYTSGPGFVRSVSGRFTQQAPIGVTCQVSSTESGTLTIDNISTSVPSKWTIDFSATRVGSVQQFVLTRDASGLAAGGFAIIAPIGLPCGGPAVGEFAGVISATSNV